MILNRLILVFLLFFIFSCNTNKSDEEMDELWSKAQTTGEIINRSGTKFNSGANKELALRDAETRLQSGGGLFGEGGLNFGGLLGEGDGKNDTTASVSMPVNTYLWRGALNTIDFMPISSADPIGGTIITDWYSTTNNENERCKLNIFISGKKLSTENLKVTSFCQEYKNQKWLNKNIDSENNNKIENAILNRAKKLRLQSS